MIPSYKIKFFCISVIYIRQFTYMFNYFKFIFHNYFTLQRVFRVLALLNFSANWNCYFTYEFLLTGYNSVSQYANAGTTT